MLLSPAVALIEEAVLVNARGDEPTQALVAGVRSVSSLCTGDRDWFATFVQAGSLTLMVDIDQQELSAPLALKATLTVFERAR